LIASIAARSGPHLRAAGGRRRALRGGLTLAFVLAAAMARAEVSEDVTHLRWRREVLARPSVDQAVIVEEDSIIAAASRRDLADVRLMNNKGELLPLAWLPPQRMFAEERLFREFPLEWRRGEDGLWGVTFDLGPSPPETMVAELVSAVGPWEVRFFGGEPDGGWSLLPQEVAEPRSGGMAWRIERVAPLLRLAVERDLPQATTRDRLRLLIREEIPTPRERLAFRSLEAGFAFRAGGAWRATLQVKGPPRLLTRLDVRGLRPGRNAYGIMLEARLEAGGWRQIDVTSPPELIEGSVDSVVFRPVRTDALRLTVRGADAPNDPVEVEALLATPQRWIFEVGSGPDVETGGALWLAYGDPHAVPPPHPRSAPEARPEPREAADHGPGAGGEDQASTVSRSDGDSSRRGSRALLGPPESNPFHREPGFGLEWLRRHPTVVTVAMLIVVAVVAVLALSSRGRGAAARPSTGRDPEQTPRR